MNDSIRVAESSVKIKIFQTVLDHTILHYHFSLRKGWYAITGTSGEYQTLQSKKCEIADSEPSNSTEEMCAELSNETPGNTVLNCGVFLSILPIRQHKISWKSWTS